MSCIITSNADSLLLKKAAVLITGS